MPFFDIFASPRWSPLRMRTKVVSFFIFFQELSNKKKIKALWPKMTKIASRGGPALSSQFHYLHLLSNKFSLPPPPPPTHWGQVTWLSKLREGTYLVKMYEHALSIERPSRAWKQVKMQEKAQPCASLWRKTLHSKRVRFLTMLPSLTMCVCLSPNFLTLMQPLCEFSWRRKKEKAW